MYIEEEKIYPTSTILRDHGREKGCWAA